MPKGPVRDSEEVRADILNAAEALMVERGVRSLRLRDVLSRSGASNGQLYGIFPNLDEIVLQVNTRTLQRLESRLQAITAKDPVSRLTEFARCYLAFASEDTALWRALFQWSPTEISPNAVYLQSEQAKLFEYPTSSLAELFPEMTDNDILLRARTLFSAVHGVISISLESRFAGVTLERLEEEMVGLVRAAIAGYRMET